MPEPSCHLCGAPWVADWADHVERHARITLMQRAAAACRAAEQVDLADELQRRLDRIQNHNGRAA